MTKYKKRRVQKSKPHQVVKTGNGGKKPVNWTRILIISTGIIIALSMVLSLIAIR